VAWWLAEYLTVASPARLCLTSSEIVITRPTAREGTGVCAGTDSVTGTFCVPRRPEKRSSRCVYTNSVRTLAAAMWHRVQMAATQRRARARSAAARPRRRKPKACCVVVRSRQRKPEHVAWQRHHDDVSQSTLRSRTITAMSWQPDHAGSLGGGNMRI
jgi:hypothetical protein